MILRPFKTIENKTVRYIAVFAFFSIFLFELIVVIQTNGVYELLDNIQDNTIYFLVGVPFFILIFMVENKFLKRNSFVSEWTNPDGSQLNLKKDGSFSATNLSQKWFSLNPESDQYTSGSGRWTIHGGFWLPKELVLKFRIIDGTRYTKVFKMKIAERPVKYFYIQKELESRYKLTKIL